RFSRDWSSDVCSSDLALEVAIEQVGDLEANGYEGADVVFITDGDALYGEDSFIEMKAKGINLWTVAIALDMKTSNRHLYSYASRSEERRVGKGGGARW